MAALLSREGEAARSTRTTKKKVVVESRQSFGEVLRDLLISHGCTTSGIGNPDWAGFAQDLGDAVSYESLRKAVTSEREPGLKIMEAVAEALGIKPDIFWEYRLAQARRCFDPREVGAAEAYKNLQLWLAAQAQ